MLKVHYIACAASSAVDGKTNKLSLFHVLDEISSPTYPLQLGSFCVAALFERETNEDAIQTYALAISFNGVLLASFTMRLDFRTARRNRSVNTIAGLTIPGPGALSVTIVQRNSVLAEWRMPTIQTSTMTVAKEMPQAPQNEKSPAAAKAGPTIN